jgi:hypothetical protein
MQIMPGTAETLGLEDAFSPSENVDAGARYLKQLLDRYHGDRRLALGAYNAGPARVDNAGGIPDIPETIDYVSRILGDLSDEETPVGADSGKIGSENLAAPSQASQSPVKPAVESPVESPVPPDASSSPRTAPAPPPAP